MQSQVRYEAPGKPRHHIIRVDGVETIVVPARRNWFALPFLAFWLTMWTLGGGVALNQLFRHFEAFLLLWLVGWAFGWVIAAASIVWQLSGREQIAVEQGDLLVQLRAGPMRRTRRYRGGEVRHLHVRPQTVMGRNNTDLAPFLERSGALQFVHGVRTVGLASGVDEAEAAMIRDWLLARLPN